MVSIKKEQKGKTLKKSLKEKLFHLKHNVDVTACLQKWTVQRVICDFIANFTDIFWKLLD